MWTEGRVSQRGLSLPKCSQPLREILAAIAGFVVVALIPPTFMALFAPLFGGTDIENRFGTFVIYGSFSAVFVALLGIPAFLLLRPFRPGHWWSVFAAGFLLGSVVAIILALPNHPHPAAVVALGCVTGVLALIFWVIWLYGGLPETPISKSSN